MQTTTSTIRRDGAGTVHRPRLRRLIVATTPAPAGQALRGRMPWGLVGMLALVVLVERFVAAHPLDFSDPTRLSTRASASAARDEAPGRDVLFFGDSLIKFSMLPRVIEARSGLRVSNLGIGGSLPQMSCAILRRALEAGARPKAVVVDFKPLHLLCAPEFNLPGWQEIASPRELLELVVMCRHSTFLGRLWLGRLLPSVRSRHEIRSNVMAALRGERDPLGIWNRAVLRNWDVNHGAHVAAPNPKFTGTIDDPTALQMQTMARWPHYQHLVSVQRFFRMASERGIRVYWLLPPFPPEIQRRREESGAEARYLQLVHSVCEHYPNITVLDARHSGYDHTRFCDVSHLHGQAARTLSADVADVLRRELKGTPPDGPRWVCLPDDRPCTVDVVLEDCEASRDAVQ